MVVHVGDKDLATTDGQPRWTLELAATRATLAEAEAEGERGMIKDRDAVALGDEEQAAADRQRARPNELTIFRAMPTDRALQPQL